jgi:hypothetical protein
MLHTQSTEPVLLDEAEVRRLRIGALGPVDFVESVYLLDGAPDSVIDPCADQPPGFVFDPTTCACTCPVQAIQCPQGQEVDPVTCTCVAALPDCGANDRVVVDVDASTVVCAATLAPELAVALQQLDAGAAEEVCGGVASRELGGKLAPEGALSQSLDLGAQADTCSGSPSPNTVNDTASFAIGVVPSKGYDVKLEILAESSVLFDTDCWLVVSSTEDGELRYLASRHDGQAAGGGIYLAGDHTERAYVTCIGRWSGAPAATNVAATLALVPR